MFRRKESQDFIYQTNIKRGITRHFSQTLKKLQLQHLQDEGNETIYSNDSSNNMCNALEAVFLHGLKDSVAQKLTSYVGIAQPLDPSSSLSFWSIAEKFTHKDVTEQLRSLNHINSEIGLCRSWIRLALNDGLMESYLHSMIVDTKTLQYYYHSFSFLRDHEQPGILKNYLTGLMSLQFQLSFNSSVLNLWNNSTLQLIGFLDLRVPLPAVSAIVAESEKKTVDKQKERKPHIVVEKASYEEPIVVNRKSTRQQSERPPHMFSTISDVENIRRLGHQAKSVGSQLSYTLSEDSSSSHVSCPDPELSPVQKKFEKFLSPAVSPQSMDSPNSDLQPELDIVSGSSTHSSNIEHIPKSFQQKNKNRKPQEHDVSIPPSEGREKTNDQKETKEKQLNSDELFHKDKELTLSLNDNSDSLSKHKINQKTSSPVLNKRTLNIDEICANLPPLKLDPMEQEAILKKVLREFDREADKYREMIQEHERLFEVEKLRTEAEKREMNLEMINSQSSKKEDEIDLSQSGVSIQEVGIVNSASNESQVSNLPFEDFKSVLSFQDQVQNTSLYVTNEANEINPSGETILADSRSEDSSSVEPPSNVGNSLGKMLGWSSQMRSQPKATESFESMLEAYTVTRENTTNVRAEDIIQSLEQSIPIEETVSLKDTNVQNIEQWTDLTQDGFEVLHSPFGSVGADIDMSYMIYLYRVPQEHGLSHQNFTCRGCTRPIGIIYGQPRLCEFDGGLYCYECHENNETFVPSSIIFDWDFRKKKVCVANYKHLQDLEEQPLYNLQDLNPKLFNHVPQLDELKSLREQLCYLKSYLFTCSQKVAESLRQKVWPREHLYDSQDLYSLVDLLQVESGQLYKSVKDLVRFSSKHVYECNLCSQKGFVCEICRSPKVIYPFETESTTRCSTCKTVYHKTCMTENLPCPKCERWGKRIKEQVASGNVVNHPEDYGISPQP